MKWYLKTLLLVCLCTSCLNIEANRTEKLFNTGEHDPRFIGWWTDPTPWNNRIYYTHFSGDDYTYNHYNGDGASTGFPTKWRTENSEALYEMEEGKSAPILGQAKGSRLLFYYRFSPSGDSIFTVYSPNNPETSDNEYELSYIRAQKPEWAQ